MTTARRRALHAGQTNDTLVVTVVYSELGGQLSLLRGRIVSRREHVAKFPNGSMSLEHVVRKTIKIY
jgi:hypothetical protein